MLLPVKSQTRKYSNEFLNIGVDAAAFGKSNAVIASTNDVNSGYWNPAGLIHIKDKQLSLMHASYFANIANYDYAAFATPIDDKSTLALSIIRFGVDDILDTRALITAGGEITPFENLPRFSTADYAFTLSYARKPFNKNFSYGVNAKVIRRVIGDFATAWGFGLDAGLQLISKNKKWTWGIMIRDLTTTYNSWQIEDGIFDNDLGDDPQDSGSVNALNQQEAPETTEITLPSVRIGLNKNFTITKDVSLDFEADGNFRFAQTNDVISNNSFSIAPAFGFEANFKKLIFLRGGVGNFQKVKQFDNTNELGFQPNFGVGFHYKGVSVDYALTDIGDQSASLYSNVFSLRIDWNLFR
nr:PorV/PorQ family protein [Aquimarina agarivorans]